MCTGSGSCDEWNRTETYHPRHTRTELRGGGGRPATDRDQEHSSPTELDQGEEDVASLRAARSSGGAALVFNYLPMYGVLIAFVDHRWGKGVFGPTWNNFEHFRLICEHPYFG